MGPARDGHHVGTLESTRRTNLAAVLRLVHTTGGASRTELAAATGLNRSTVAALVAELASRGLVVEQPPVASGLPGRPSPVVVPRASSLEVLAVECFPDSAAVALVGLGGHVRAIERRYRTREPYDPASMASVLADLARPMLARGSVRAVGVAVAGVVARERGTVARAPNLGWRGVPLAALLRSAFHLPPDVPVSLGNDADLAALAEHRRGAGVGANDFVLLWGGVGVGAGVLAGGRALTGRDGSAGEVGHLPFRADGQPCHCGARGCWETEVSEPALLAHAGIPAEAGRGGVATLLERARAAQPDAMRALACVGRDLGIGLAGIVAVLDPERIALGGMFADIYPHVRDEIARALSERRMTDRDVEVMAARLGSDAPLLGAAELALDPSIDDPSAHPADVSLPARALSAAAIQREVNPVPGG